MLLLLSQLSAGEAPPIPPVEEEVPVWIGGGSGGSGYVRGGMRGRKQRQREERERKAAAVRLSQSVDEEDFHLILAPPGRMN